MSRGQPDDPLGKPADEALLSLLKNTLYRPGIVKSGLAGSCLLFPFFPPEAELTPTRSGSRSCPALAAHRQTPRLRARASPPVSVTRGLAQPSSGSRRSAARPASRTLV